MKVQGRHSLTLPVLGILAAFGSIYGAYQLGVHSEEARQESSLERRLEESRVEGRREQYEIMKSPLIGSYFAGKAGDASSSLILAPELNYARADLSFDVSYDKWKNGERVLADYVLITPGEAMKEKNDLLTPDGWLLMLKEGQVQVYLISTPENMDLLETDPKIREGIGKYLYLDSNKLEKIKMPLKEFRSANPWNHVKDLKHDKGIYHAQWIEPAN